ncbi:MAG: T9SS type A sorting domain-containing protein [Bacteroidaceae bacterium]|nr:T9SS type A sorting domain-containing protein [Bacteroidaceae bacterium]
MKGKTILAMLAVVLWSLPGRAGSALLMHLSDSTVVVCSLAQEPLLTFGEKRITLSSQEGTVGQWEFADVESWHFADTEDQIARTKDEKPQVKITQDRLTISGNKGLRVAVYDTGGRQRTPALTASGNTTSLSLGGLTKGTYLLKVGNSSVKFVVR